MAWPVGINRALAGADRDRAQRCHAPPGLSATV